MPGFVCTSKLLLKKLTCTSRAQHFQWQHRAVKYSEHDIGCWSRSDSQLVDHATENMKLCLFYTVKIMCVHQKLPKNFQRPQHFVLYQLAIWALKGGGMGCAYVTHFWLTDSRFSSFVLEWTILTHIWWFHQEK